MTLLMQERPKLLTNDDVRTCKDLNKLKRKLKSGIQENVLWMNIKNTNSGYLENKDYCHIKKLTF